VPVQLLGRVRVVVDLYYHGLALLETQQRSWELTVIGYRRNDVLRRDFHRTCSNAQGVIRRTSFRSLEIRKHSRKPSLALPGSIAAHAAIPVSVRKSRRDGIFSLNDLTFEQQLTSNDYRKSVFKFDATDKPEG
jgi:hypothetical protein